MPNPQFVRGMVAGRQATPNVAAATLAPLDYLTRARIQPIPSFDTPEFLVYSNWYQRQTFPTTVVGHVEFAGWVDDKAFGWFLCGLYGAPTLTANLATWAGGLNDPAPMTFAKLNGMTTDWEMTDTMLTELNIHITAATGRVEFDGRGIGIVVPDPIAALSYTAAPGNPFRAGQTVASKIVGQAGTPVALGILAMNISLRSPADPLYTTPVAFSSTQPFVTPTEMEHHGSTGEMDVLWRYDTHTASSLLSAMRGLIETWTLECRRPDITGPPVPDILITMNNFSPQNPDPQDDKPRTRQMVRGPLLYDPTATSGVKIALATTQTYPAS